MIKCITFDLDDTLWEIEPVIIKAEIKFEEWLKRNYPIISEELSIQQLRNFVRQTSLENPKICLLYTSPSPRDRQKSRMPSSA